MSNKKKQTAVEYISVIIGTALMAFACQCIYDPIGLVIGGFTGLSIIIKSVSSVFIEGGIPLWITNLILNAPVFIIGYLRLGKRFIGRTLFGTVMLSVWLYIIPSVDLTQGDYTLAAIFGGVLEGAGMGLVLRSKATTGGTDMVATLIQSYVRHCSIVRIMQILDGSIVLIGMYVFGLRPALYAIAAVFCMAKVSDAIMEGFKYSKAAYIITDRHDEVAKAILEDLDRGVTGLKARGMYTQNEKCVLYCVVSQKEIVALKELVVEIDPKAFVIVSDVREVLGEGFLEYAEE